jgi:integrase
MAKQRKDGRWVISYRVQGQKNPISESFPATAAGKVAAETRELEIKLAKKKGQAVRGKSGVYLDQLGQVYFDDAKTRGTSQRWRKEWAHVFNTFVLPALSYKPVEELDYADVLRMARVWDGRSASTIQRYLGYLKAIFEFGVKQDIISRHPMAKWSKVKEPKRDMKLTVEDLERILQHAAPHLAWAIEVEWALGTRPGVTELFAIKWADVDFERGIIHVRGTKTSDSNRLVPFGPDFRSRLLEMRDQAATEFLIEYEGRPLKKLRTSWSAAVRRAGITYNVRMYDIRHLFATVMLVGGADLAAVSALLGHSGIHTTQKHYYHLLAGEKERAIATKPGLGKPKAGKIVRIA